MSRVVLDKELSKSEAMNYFIYAHHFIHEIKGNPITLHINKKTIHAKIDARDRIWLSKVRKVIKLYSGLRVRLEYNNDGSYTLVPTGVKKV